METLILEPTFMRLALFDLDHTLLSGDSDFEWGQFLAAQGVFDSVHHAAENQAFYDDYKEGKLDIDAFLAFQLEPLARFSRAQLDQWHRCFMTERILPLVSPAALERVRAEKARAQLVAIVTATNRFVTGPIASLFGIEHLIATEPAQNEVGEFTGKVQGIPSFREGKITRVDEWLTDLGHRWQDFTETAFYSDSQNDLPLLERASEPVVVNPDPVLSDLAQQRGWPVYYWKS
ncbi:Phosphoserine phosphatase [mine drainage metagenome]|uniref:Phosphoserine phosphatase n=1 Tax=mine drainage metagenome TaxID=410659 RepID=T0Z9N9_9ZZZZ